MSRIILSMTLILFAMPLFLGCSNDDDKNQRPQNPVDQLPPATQTGEETFGCLVDGKVFIPSGSSLGGPVLDCVYQFIDGEYYLSLQGNRRKDGMLQGVTLGTFKLKIEQSGVYSLSDNIDGNAFGGWWFNPNSEYTFLYTSSTNIGKLHITTLDETRQIVSGTFWFDIFLPNGEIVEIREGRFDMPYTI